MGVDDDIHVALAVNSAPAISAVALRVRDAQAAFTRCVSLGAWPVEATARPMELNIPGIHGVGASKVFFVDRWRDFSIYDVDFVSIPTVASQVESVAALHWFGAVQYVGAQRAAHWEAFYVALFGFVPVPAQQQFGILPKGSILASPCGSLYWQLIEPDADHVGDTTEALARVALRTPDVPRAVAHLRKLGLDFVETDQLHTEQRGAISQAYLGGVMFELVSQQ